MCAFNLIGLDGKDLRRKPIEKRESTLQKRPRQPHPGIVFKPHYIVEGATAFKTPASSAAKASCRGGLGSTYRSERVDHWLKIKNPKAPAVTRKAEEDWSR